MRSDPSEARIFPRAWVLGIGVRRKGPGIPEGLSARCPDSFAGWISWITARVPGLTKLIEE